MNDELLTLEHGESCPHCEQRVMAPAHSCHALRMNLVVAEPAPIPNALENVQAQGDRARAALEQMRPLLTDSDGYQDYISSAIELVGDAVAEADMVLQRRASTP